jgi:hypothetical protein
MIFKQASCEDELFESMQIVQNQAVIKEDNSQNILIMQAIKELNLAAQSFEKIGSVQRAKETTAIIMSVTENKLRKTASVKNEFFEFLGIKYSGVNELGEEELGKPGEEELLLEDPTYEKNLQSIELNEEELQKYKPGKPKVISDPNKVLQEIFQGTPNKKKIQKRKKSKPESKQTYINPRTNIQDWAKTYSALRMILKNDNIVKVLQEGRRTKSISPQEYITKGKQRVNELMNAKGFVGPYDIDSITSKTWEQVIKESMPEINLGKNQ